jgi:hypothetical protein
LRSPPLALVLVVDFLVLFFAGLVVELVELVVDLAWPDVALATVADVVVAFRAVVVVALAVVVVTFLAVVVVALAVVVVLGAPQWQPGFQV